MWGGRTLIPAEKAHPSQISLREDRQEDTCPPTSLYQVTVQLARSTGLPVPCTGAELGGRVG